MINRFAYESSQACYLQHPTGNLAIRPSTSLNKSGGQVRAHLIKSVEKSILETYLTGSSRRALPAVVPEILEGGASLLGGYLANKDKNDKYVSISSVALVWISSRNRA